MRVAALACSAALLAAPRPAPAETRRALLVGISNYSAGQTAGARGVWTDLKGPVTDSRTLREILVASHGFSPENVHLLLDGQATRERILDAMKTVLVDPVKPGDVCVFYYAGHGSQVRNSKTAEPDGKDETIVPFDARSGGRDIRDKELARLFNDAIDKGAVLTVLFDSCHSGSAARGIEPGAARWVPPDPGDAAEGGPEADDARPDPEKREGGALVLSAAQDDQQAYETTDARGVPHGAFSLGLIRALQSGAGQSAESVYRRTRALMHVQGAHQDPVMAGPKERLVGPLFGGASDDVPRSVTVPVLGAAGRDRVTVEGGSAIGLNPGCELARAGAAASDPLRLCIESVEGLNRATARLTGGKLSDLRKGDMLRVDRWTADDGEGLRLWVPANLPDPVETARWAASLCAAPPAPGGVWISDPTEDAPTHEIGWNGKAWELRSADGSAVTLGAWPTASELADGLAKGKVTAARVFLDLPPAPGIAGQLSLDPRNRNAAIRPAADRRSADYVLAGRAADGRTQFAWIRRGVQARPHDALPRSTDWVACTADPAGQADAGRSLWDAAMRLARIHGWITLNPPPDAGYFPYRLALKRQSTGEIRNEGRLVEGDRFGLVLQAAPTRSRQVVERRYVYVFALDSRGNSTLLFPPAGRGSVENRVPYEVVTGASAPVEITLGGPFRIGPPHGVDTYVLLASNDPVPSPDIVFHNPGGPLRANLEADDAEGAALAARFMDVGVATRASRRPVSAHWCIQRLTFLTVARE